MLKPVKIKSRLCMGLIQSRADLNVAKFIFYFGAKPSENQVYNLDDAKNILQHPKFRQQQKTVLYIHGYLENRTVESVQVIVNSYLNRNDHNIIILDYGELADGNYILDAVPNAKQLAPKIAKILLELFTNQQLSIEKFHLVGHSLGGQMSGIIGRKIIEKSKNTMKLKRISALDPAYPPFYLGPFTRHISHTDAEFVDVIHTDAWLYGAPVTTGTADFWPNSGKTLQPGCPRRNYKMLSDNDLCSHWRSWWFWAESVSGEYTQKFISVKANSWSDFKRGQTEVLDRTILMGIDCPTDITGDFYLQTNGEPPFAKGAEGVQHRK